MAQIFSQEGSNQKGMSGRSLSVESECVEHVKLHQIITIITTWRELEILLYNVDLLLLIMLTAMIDGFDNR